MWLRADNVSIRRMLVLGWVQRNWTDKKYKLDEAWLQAAEEEMMNEQANVDAICCSCLPCHR
jgi:hypothetical protein